MACRARKRHVNHVGFTLKLCSVFSNSAIFEKVIVPQVVFDFLKTDFLPWSLVPPVVFKHGGDTVGI